MKFLRHLHQPVIIAGIKMHKKTERGMHLKNLLANSVFYPASGLDGTAIKKLSSKYRHFFHADYSTSQEEVENAMANHFYQVGYDLCEQQIIPYHRLISPRYGRQIRSTLNDYETDRLTQIPFISDRLEYRNFRPFAIWSRYRYNQNRAGIKADKAICFELLHVGGEACEVFNALYLNAGINPEVLVFINPSEGYGDNWTCFTESGFRLHNSVMLNAQLNGARTPGMILKNVSAFPDPEPIWDEYHFREGFTHHYREYSKIGVFERG